jgi:hypothetical protein
MSIISGTGSSTTTDAMLAAIMKRLDAMDDKLKTLIHSERRWPHWRHPRRSWAPSTAAIEHVDIAHTALNAKFHRIEKGQRALTQDQPPAHGRGRQGDNNADHGGDFIPTSHKLEFTKYDGTDDPLPWLNRCKH